MTTNEIIEWIYNYEKPIDNIEKFASELTGKIVQMNFIASNNGMKSWIIMWTWVFDYIDLKFKWESSFRKENNYI